jgi:superfamily II RNA helicase
MRTWLYIIAEEESDGKCKGPCKIGISANPWDRASSLEAGCPGGSLLVVHAFGLPDRQIAQELETHFHKWRKRDRIHREWFAFHPDEAMSLLRQHIAATFDEHDFYEKLLDILDSVEEGRRTDLSPLIK